MSVYPTPSWWVKPAQRAAGKLLKTFTTEKHTGSGIEPGFPNCEAHAFPQRHYTLPDVWIEKFRGISFHPTTFSLVSQSIHIPQMDKDFTPKELEDTIHRLKKGKATGWDLIPYEIIKFTPNSLNLRLLNIYNQIKTQRSFPLSWREINIIPIYKKGDPTNPENYRHISLLSNYLKLFTSLIATRLTLRCETQAIIPEEQAAFRKNRSTQDHIFSLHTLINHQLQQKKGKLYTFFIDLSKAFDSINHQSLMLKFINLGISTQYLTLIKALLETLTIKFKLEDSKWELIPLPKVVPQGYSHSPLLFNLYI